MTKNHTQAYAAPVQGTWRTSRLEARHVSSSAAPGTPGQIALSSQYGPDGAPTARFLAFCLHGGTAASPRWVRLKVDLTAAPPALSWEESF